MSREIAINNPNLSMYADDTSIFHESYELTQLIEAIKSVSIS